MKSLKTLLTLMVMAGVIGVAPASRGAEDQVDKALRYALGQFNKTIPTYYRKRELNYIRYKLLAPTQWRQILAAYKKPYANEEQRAEAIQKQISELWPICFITMRDGTTYWSSFLLKQRFVFGEYFSGVRGKVKGEPFHMSLTEMRRELKMLEFPLDYSGAAIATRWDKSTFVITNVKLYAEENEGSWHCSYEYTAPGTGKKERRIIFGSPDYPTSWREIKRIVFGLQRPKMNEKTHQLYPSDYKYDPYDRKTLVPVKWMGPIHIVE